MISPPRSRCSVVENILGSKSKVSFTPSGLYSLSWGELFNLCVPHSTKESNIHPRV